jgi:hypothetical protein
LIISPVLLKLVSSAPLQRFTATTIASWPFWLPLG